MSPRDHNAYGTIGQDIPDHEVFRTIEVPASDAELNTTLAGIGGYKAHSDPDLTVLPNFLSDEEVEHILELAKGVWAPSAVWTGGSNRSSWSCLLASHQTPIVEAIERRVAAVTGVDIDQVERLNLIRYEPGQHFGAHHDSRLRPYTVFVYLSDVGRGGETRFTKIGLQVKASRGAAAVWPNLHSDGTVDNRTIHKGMPVEDGVKYGMNCFVSKNARHDPCYEPGHDGVVMEKWWQRSSIAVREMRVCNLRQLIAEVEPQPASQAGGQVATLMLLEVHQNPYFAVIPNLLQAGEIARLLTFCEQPDLAWIPSSFECEGTSQSVTLGEVVRASVATRVAAVLGVDVGRVTDLSIVRYLPGQYTYEQHAGPNMEYTVLVYLTDLPDGDDGATDFKVTGLQFFPSTGSALVWRNRTADGSLDGRMRHTEMPMAGLTRYHLLCHIRANDSVEETVRLCRQQMMEDAAAQLKDAGKEAHLRVLQLSAQPWLGAVPALLKPNEVQDLMGIFADRNVAWMRCLDNASTSESVPLSGSALLNNLKQRLSMLLDVDAALVDDFRMERHLPGQFTFKQKVPQGVDYCVIIYLYNCNDAEAGSGPEEAPDRVTDFSISGVESVLRIEASLGAAVIWRGASGSIYRSEPISMRQRQHLTCRIYSPGEGG